MPPRLSDFLRDTMKGRKLLDSSTTLSKSSKACTNQLTLAVVPFTNASKPSKLSLKEMRKRKVDEAMVDRMVDLWRDRLPVKVIAMELGLSYTSVHKQLKKMSLIG
jgi:hypothetical protein